MKKFLRKLLYATKLVIITTPCVILTFYIAVNCYEIIFQKDLRFVSAITAFSSPEIINEIGQTNESSFEEKQRFIRQIHKPKSIKFAALGSRLEIVPAIQKNDEWLAYANKGQYILLNENGESGVGNMLVYVRRSWRTIIEPEKLENGSKFTLETEGYNNLYKVVERKLKPIHEDFIVSDLPKSYLLLVIEDNQIQANYFIKAVFVSQDRSI